LFEPSCFIPHMAQTASSVKPSIDAASICIPAKGGETAPSLSTSISVDVGSGGYSGSSPSAYSDPVSPTTQPLEYEELLLLCDERPPLPLSLPPSAPHTPEEPAFHSAIMSSVCLTVAGRALDTISTRSLMQPCYGLEYRTLSRSSHARSQDSRTETAFPVGLGAAGWKGPPTRRAARGSPFSVVWVLFTVFWIHTFTNGSWTKQAQRSVLTLLLHLAVLLATASNFPEEDMPVHFLPHMLVMVGGSAALYVAWLANSGLIYDWDTEGVLRKVCTTSLVIVQCLFGLILWWRDGVRAWSNLRLALGVATSIRFATTVLLVCLVGPMASFPPSHLTLPEALIFHVVGVVQVAAITEERRHGYALAAARMRRSLLDLTFQRRKRDEDDDDVAHGVRCHF
jgi:hypothetical protein